MAKKKVENNIEEIFETNLPAEDNMEGTDTAEMLATAKTKLANSKVISMSKPKPSAKVRAFVNVHNEKLDSNYKLIDGDVKPEISGPAVGLDKFFSNVCTKLGIASVEDLAPVEDGPVGGAVAAKLSAHRVPQHQLDNVYEVFKTYLVNEANNKPTILNATFNDPSTTPKYVELSINGETALYEYKDMASLLIKEGLPVVRGTQGEEIQLQTNTAKARNRKIESMRNKEISEDIIALEAGYTAKIAGKAAKDVTVPYFEITEKEEVVKIASDLKLTTKSVDAEGNVKTLTTSAKIEVPAKTVEIAPEYIKFEDKLVTTAVGTPARVLSDEEVNDAIFKLRNATALAKKAAVETGGGVTPEAIEYNDDFDDDEDDMNI